MLIFVGIKLHQFPRFLWKYSSRIPPPYISQNLSVIHFSFFGTYHRFYRFLLKSIGSRGWYIDWYLVTIIHPCCRSAILSKLWQEANFIYMFAYNVQGIVSPHLIRVWCLRKLQFPLVQLWMINFPHLPNWTADDNISCQWLWVFQISLLIVADIYQCFWMFRKKPREMLSRNMHIIFIFWFGRFPSTLCNSFEFQWFSQNLSPICFSKPIGTSWPNV